MRKFAVWASLASQMLIVVTGAIVRLTGSGLGCPTWPKCTEDSLTSIPEQGIHGIIEFGNRLLTFLLAAIAIWALVLFWKTAERKIAITLLGGVVFQALLGGVTVLTGLNSWIVGAHYFVSAILIWIAAKFVWRFYAPEIKPAPSLSVLISWLVVLFGTLSIIAGVLVTGAGPHAGDAKTPRNGLDLDLWQHFHSYPGYITLGLVVVQLVLVRENRFLLRLNLGLVVALALQAIVGVIQSRLGVPGELVALHVLGSTILIALFSMQQSATRKA